MTARSAEMRGPLWVLKRLAIPGLVLVFAGCVAADPEPDAAGTVPATTTSLVPGTLEPPERANPVYQVTPSLVERGAGIEVDGIVLTNACINPQLWTGSEWEIALFSVRDEDTGLLVTGFRRMGPEFSIECALEGGAPPRTPFDVAVPIDAEPGIYRYCDHRVRCSNNFEIL